MDRLSLDDPEHDTAWIWRIVRIVGNDLSFTEDEFHIVRAELPLEHPLERVPAEYDAITFHDQIGALHLAFGPTISFF